MFAHFYTGGYIAYELLNKMCVLDTVRRAMQLSVNVLWKSLLMINEAWRDVLMRLEQRDTNLPVCVIGQKREEQISPFPLNNSWENGLNMVLFA
jgi:hypothetical protein